MLLDLVTRSLSQLQEANKELVAKLDKRDGALLKMRESNRSGWHRDVDIQILCDFGIRPIGA